MDIEENARSGALLDAISSFKAFLETSGANYLAETRSGGGKAKGVREFTTQLQAAASGIARQLRPVRWYLEEEQTEWSDGNTKSRYRAWCLAAFSKEKSEEVFSRMLEVQSFQATNQTHRTVISKPNNFSSPLSLSPELVDLRPKLNQILRTPKKERRGGIILFFDNYKLELDNGDVLRGILLEPSSDGDIRLETIDAFLTIPRKRVRSIVRYR